jgi:cytochrome c-type biogenesis protein CcmH
VGALVITVGLAVQAQGADWRDIAGELMSPACPGRTLLNCTSTQAEQWRELIRQKLTQGESKEQIVQYFIDIGGDGILAAPPKRGFALAAWLLPAFVLLNGAGLIFLLTLRWARQHSVEPSKCMDGNPHAPAEETTSDPYMNRLRHDLEQWNK